MIGQAWVTCPSREDKIQIIRTRGMVNMAEQIKTTPTLVYFELEMPRAIF